MAWTLTDTDTATSVTFTVPAGETVEVVEQPTGVWYPLRGSAPMVTVGPARLAGLSTPDWLVIGDAAWAQMKAILTAGHRLTITDDMGAVSTVRVDGGYQMRVEDTPNRGTSPRRRVKVKLVGVA
jgi:hypothetical protein